MTFSFARESTWAAPTFARRTARCRRPPARLRPKGNTDRNTCSEYATNGQASPRSAPKVCGSGKPPVSYLGTITFQKPYQVRLMLRRWCSRRKDDPANRPRAAHHLALKKQQPQAVASTVHKTTNNLHHRIASAKQTPAHRSTYI